jgi:hypothetical protein
MNFVHAGILGAALLATPLLSAASDIDVMTQNQYLGADLTPVLDAATATYPSQDAFLAGFSNAVVNALVKIAANRPAERARALAAEIADRNPDVVGLQEAYKFDCLPWLPNYPTLPGRGCDDPTIRGAFTDHLQDTADALHARYVVAGRVTNLNVTGVPFLVNGYPALIVVADRDAILVRRGLHASWVNFAPIAACAKPSDQGCNYLTAPPPLSTPAGTIAIERGFLAVDVTVHGQALAQPIATVSRSNRTHAVTPRLTPRSPSNFHSPRIGIGRRSI